jgi:hypothetical protein
MNPQKLTEELKLNIDIVIASVLKPINDVRMFEKITLAGVEALPQARWHIIGFKTSQKLTPSQNISFYPIFNFKRLSWKRGKANFILYKYLKKINPRLIIVTTFELLPAAVRYAQKYKVKLVYDVQENYALNVQKSGIYSKLIGFLLSKFIKKIEKWASRWIDLYLIAEKIYLKQMPFLAEKCILLENKTNLDEIPFEKKYNTNLHFIFAGTIGKSYGIFVLLDWIEKVKFQNSSIILTIIGFCAKEDEYKKIKKWAENKEWVNLIGGDYLIPHSKIIQKIKEADIWVMPYLPKENFYGKIPTKFYEGLALKKIMLIQKNKEWQCFFEQFNFNASLFIDFKNEYEIQKLLKIIENTEFYKIDKLPAWLTWENEKIAWQEWLKKTNL